MGYQIRKAVGGPHDQDPQTYDGRSSVASYDAMKYPRNDDQHHPYLMVDHLAEQRPDLTAAYDPAYQDTTEIGFVDGSVIDEDGQTR